MGSAILSGWIGSDEAPAKALTGKNFFVVDPNDEKLQSLISEYGISGSTSIDDIEAYAPEVVLLAVKPQIMQSVLDELSDLKTFQVDDGATDSQLPLLLSIAAGIPIDIYQDVFEENVHVIRIMPNMPLQVMLGATVLAKGSSTTDDEIELVRQLFDCLGFASIVDESQIDAVCALSGGGPAYVAKFIEGFVDAGIKAGLSGDLAEKLMLTTIGGSYKMLTEKGISPADLRVSVCSPGGTTLAAIKGMDEVGFDTSIENGVEAAIERAKELSS